MAGFTGGSKEIIQKKMAERRRDLLEHVLATTPKENALSGHLRGVKEEELARALGKAMKDYFAEKPVQENEVPKEPVLKTNLDEKALEHALKKAMQDTAPEKPALETNLDEEALEHALKEALQDCDPEKPMRTHLSEKALEEAMQDCAAGKPAHESNILKEPVLETNLSEEALEHSLKTMQDYVPAKPIPGECTPGASLASSERHFVPRS